jgi:hypothetical protein
MVDAATCQSLFAGHCAHWGLTDEEHALAHAMGRLVDAVDPKTAEIAGDGRWLAKLLHEEGYQVVPLDGPARG